MKDWESGLNRYNPNISTATRPWTGQKLPFSNVFLSEFCSSQTSWSSSELFSALIHIHLISSQWTFLPLRVASSWLLSSQVFHQELECRVALSIAPWVACKMPCSLSDWKYGWHLSTASTSIGNEYTERESRDENDSCPTYVMAEMRKYSRKEWPSRPWIFHGISTRVSLLCS